MLVLVSATKNGEGIKMPCAVNGLKVNNSRWMIGLENNSASQMKILSQIEMQEVVVEGSPDK